MPDDTEGVNLERLDDGKIYMMPSELDEYDSYEVEGKYTIKTRVIRNHILALIVLHIRKD